MKKWQYSHVVYDRNHKSSEVAITNIPEGVDWVSGLHIDTFLKAMGEQGWELCGTLLPFPRGKELSKATDDEDDNQTFFVADPLDIQWLIFKREL
jgi:hypothetical protein